MPNNNSFEPDVKFTLPQIGTNGQLLSGSFVIPNNQPTISGNIPMYGHGMTQPGTPTPIVAVPEPTPPKARIKMIAMGGECHVNAIMDNGNTLKVTSSLSALTYDDQIWVWSSTLDQWMRLPALP